MLLQQEITISRTLLKMNGLKIFVFTKSLYFSCLLRINYNLPSNLYPRLGGNLISCRYISLINLIKFLRSYSLIIVNLRPWHNTQRIRSAWGDDGFNAGCGKLGTCTTLIVRVEGMHYPQTGVTHYHVQLELPDKGRAIKGLVVCYIVWL